MNFKPLAIQKLREFSQEFPDYSFGELICSMLAVTGEEGKSAKEILFSMTDEEAFICLQRAIRLEKEPIESE